ncbi:MAG: DNA adenine methylase [Clostridium beijerinckii]|nr:DNA adenine methylase [Clostridium beijerinckii]
MSKRKISIRMEELLIQELLNKYLTDNVSEAVNLAAREVLEPNFTYKPPRVQLFPFLGSKPKKLTTLINDIMPSHDIFVDVFGGTGVVLSSKPTEVSKIEVYNDKNERLTNMLKIVKERPLEFYLRCKNLFVSDNIFRTFLEEKEFDNPLDDAINYFYLSATSIYGNRSSLKFNPKKRATVAYRNRLASIFEVSDRFNDVTILNRDFRYIIKKFDSPSTLYYLDPPYFGNESYYADKFTEKDHQDLAKILKRVQGKFILSYYASKEVYLLYKGSDNFYHASIRMQRQSGKKQLITEKIITNFSFEGSKPYK